MNLICVIPAKSNSSRLPRKNFQKVGPFSLVQWAIIQANEAGFRPLVVGDPGWHDEDVAFPTGRFDYVDRDPAWSSPEMNSLELAAWAIKSQLTPSTTPTHPAHPTAILLLQPTSPLRALDDILKCLEVAKAHNANVTSTNEETDEPNGAIYIRKLFLPLSEHGIIYPMPAERSIDIDVEADLDAAREEMARRMAR